jgi:hypothetical protein
MHQSNLNEWWSSEKKIVLQDSAKITSTGTPDAIFKFSCNWKAILHFQKVIVDEPQRTGVHAQLKLGFEYNTAWFRSQKNCFFFIVIVPTHALHYTFKTLKSYTKTLKIHPTCFGLVWNHLQGVHGRTSLRYWIGMLIYIPTLFITNVNQHSSSVT